MKWEKKLIQEKGVDLIIAKRWRPVVRWKLYMHELWRKKTASERCLNYHRKMPEMWSFHG